MSGIDRLLHIMTRLRNPDGGCPWDLEQTFRTIAPYTIEEAYEVADAVERDDMAALKDELGDLLLQVVFHARMAEESGAFAFRDVTAAICDKMVHRHPHVFGSERVAGAAAQTRAWEDHKATEREARAKAAGRPASALDGIARGLPAATRAVKLQARAARVGFDWPDTAPVLDKIHEEIGELRAEMADGGAPERLEDELGDILFALANLARHLALDPDAALRGANAKFERRFRAVETHLRATGHAPGQATLAEMEAAWQAVKAAED
ncbi:MAG: nucleoside triphosphate pyrophosphohydrolase [Kiloniellaceae bacterium]